MDAQGWIAVIGAITGGIVLVINTYFGWVNSRKIDDNTALTRAGVVAATRNAGLAAQATSSVKAVTEELKDRLNGGLDERIKVTVETAIASFRDEVMHSLDKIRGQIK